MKIIRLQVMFCILILFLLFIGNPEIRAQDTLDAEKSMTALPSISDTSQMESLPIVDRVFVERVDILNNTIFLVGELEKITDPYTKRMLSFEDLEELRNQLNLFYISRGYINSGVILPDQKIQAGRVAFKAIEGRITEIEINVDGRLKPSYIRKRIALGIGPPLNLNQLQERLQNIDENSLVRKIDAQLKAGVNSGEAILKANIEEEKPYYAALSFSNRLSPAVDGKVFDLEVGHNNLSGWGDSFSAMIGINKGIRNLSLKYTIPITVRDATLSLFYNNGNSEVIEEPFDMIDVESEETHYGISLNYPVINRTHNQLSVGLRLEKMDYESRLLGRPFSFSRGVVDGESHATVLRLTHEQILRSSKQVAAFSSAFSFGLSAFGADEIDPYSNFTMWLGQIQWIRKLSHPSGGQILVRANLQFTKGPLLPYEKFTIGGMNSVRGYRKDELVRDKGAFLSLEYRHSLLSLTMPKVSKAKDDGLLQLVLFTDWGWGKNKDLPTPDPSSIGSAGLGFRWYAAKTLCAEVYYGYAFRNIYHFDEDLQDKGIHFTLKWQPF